jgi:hypothetical protein
VIFFKKKEENYEKEDLIEAFFLGTFNELKRNYPNILYKESSIIDDILQSWKKKYNQKLLKILFFTFNEIKEKLENYGNKSDQNITKMKDIIKDILGKVYYASYKETENIDDILIKVNEFYKKKEYLLFTNYCSEIIKNGDTFEKNIDFNFLQDENNKSKYLDTNFSPKSMQNNIDNLEDYNDFKKKMKNRMYLSSFKKFFDMDLSNEILLCSLIDPKFVFFSEQSFDLIDNIEKNVENLENDETREIIKEILNDNKFYNLFFLILKSDIVKEFFTNNIYFDEKSEEYIISKSSIDDSECFKNIYLKFLKKYDDDNLFEDFKNLIIIKTLSKGDRACIITKIKKYIINPSQFFIGNKIEKNTIKDIITAYLIVILLHETEHFFRLLNDNNEVFNLTPRKKEGGRLFIKFLFGVESISHINEFQAKKILSIDNWKEHNTIKSIFDGEKENKDVDKNFQIIYPNSISFYSRERFNNKNFDDGKIPPIKK